MRRFVGAILFFAVCSFAASSAAKTPDDKIADLERQISALQKTYLTNNQETASAVSQIGAFQGEFNSIKGEVEETSHQLRTQHEETMRLISDIQARLQAIEDRMGMFSSQITSAIGKVSPAAGAEAELYQKGLDLTNESKYLEAASTFEAFIQKYPKSQFVGSARFWVADCFYSSRDYKRAIREYQNFVEKNPRDQKVPEALLKQGNSFYELGLYDEAKAFYDKVATAYPSSKEAAQAKSKLSKISARKDSASKTGATPDSMAPEARGPSYPTETIEQQRQKMSGAPEPLPAKPAAPKKPGLPQREF